MYELMLLDSSNDVSDRLPCFVMPQIAHVHERNGSPH